MGVGKTTLSFKVYNFLEDYNFRFTTEYLFDNKIRDFSSKNKNISFPLYKDNIQRMELIGSFLKNRNEKLLFDGFPLNSGFITSLMKNIDIKVMASDIFNRFNLYTKKYDLSRKEFEEILVIQITNNNSLEYYKNRNNKNPINDRDYAVLKYNYEFIMDEIFESLQSTGIKYKKIDITNLDINSEKKIKKFIEENLLI